MASSEEPTPTPLLEQDLEQLLTQELGLSGSSPAGTAANTSLPHVLGCPAVESAGSCTCHTLNGLRGMNDLYVSFAPGEKDAEDYANFENWIPTFVKPDQPCEYCRSKGLDCYMNFGKITCTSCNSLFRPCSFARVSGRESETPNTNTATKYTQHIDTLHTVQEDICTDRGAYTGTKLLRSRANAPAPVSDDGKKSAVRFSRTAVKILRDWFDANQDNPYPTDEEKIELEKKTGLKSNQITTWLANTRRRSKVGKNARRSYSPGPGNRRSQPVAVPTATVAKEWRDLNPFERWQHSPPENEPAPMEAIADAVKSSRLPPRPSIPCPSGARSNERVSNERGSESASRSKPTQSVTSLDIASSNSASGTTSSIAWSHGSSGSFGSFNSFGSGLHGKRDRRRKRKVKAPLHRDPSDDAKRIFQCTFCCDTFKTKYDWTRHEKTLHLSLEKWICAPLGPVFTDPHTGVKTCVYCREENPSRAHLDTHGHYDCEAKGLEARTFYRKDHLRQHMRLMHHTVMQSTMESWKASADFIKSRCGFCDTNFTSWMERNDHLAAHFRDGAHMRDWKRCRGLDPEVAANVLNAMPPYLIGMERDSPIPFSASRGTLSHKQQGTATHKNTQSQEAYPDDVAQWSKAEATSVVSSGRDSVRATCWEILTVELGRYVKAQADSGQVVTDEMIQQAARKILYENDDPWNQTAADNPEWLDLFKKAHGLDIIPSTINGVGNAVPLDLELYTDLGMRVPFSVAQKALVSTPTTNTPGGGAAAAFGDRETELLRMGMQQQQKRPDDDNTPYRSYDEVPIPAARAAHFATRTNNPLVFLTAAQHCLAQEGRQLGVEEETQWQRYADEIISQEQSRQSSTSHGMDGVQQDAVDGLDNLSPEELDQLMEDIGLSGGLGTAGGGTSGTTGSQTPSSGSQMLNTPLTTDVCMFDPFTAAAGGGAQDQPREPEADPMQWLNAEMLDVAASPGRDEGGAACMAQLGKLDAKTAADMVFGAAATQSEEFDFGDIQFEH